MFHRVVATVLLAVLWAAPARASLTRFPLKVGPTGRTLVDQTGQPFLLVGDAAWSLIAQPTLADAQKYLDDRVARGFNTVLVNLIEHKFATHAPADAKGNLPFTGRPFATPNPAYFADADQVIAAASSRGLAVLLAPIYLGYQCGDEGWCAEVQAATADEMRSWGRYVGQRYGGVDGLIWVIGGDTDPTPVADKVSQVVAGIQDFDTRHPFTAHNQPESYAVTDWPGASWLNVNDAYSYATALYDVELGAGQRTPAMPYLLIESTYENERGATTQLLHAEAYWTMLSGGMGMVFGNCPVWSFGITTELCPVSDWVGQLGSPGANGMTVAQRLFASRPWSLLVPDVNHTAITAGFGQEGTAGYVTAARASDGSTVIAYLPVPATIAVNLASVSAGPATAWWVDPATGATTAAGSFAASGTKTFTPPAGGADWVFVLDSGERGFGAPGTSSLPVPATPPGPIALLAVGLLYAMTLRTKDAN